ncbi:RidA family protein [Helicobacter aurati]|uniref:RidA family protein n=1 Tax=Helicobacter aurati TaxID=137778 RepID=A0A3D8J0K5_9HELI|nr:RidA family protein [Helicobacter aurati]RDU71069.1 RidA family protein [Helicobacter aurati]
MIQRYQENTYLAQIVVYDGYFESSGQVMLDANASIQQQTREVLAQIDRLLSSIDADKTHLTRVQMWLNDMNDFYAMNAVYEEWLKDVPKPVRACVGATLIEGAKIEIQVFGYRR